MRLILSHNYLSMIESDAFRNLANLVVLQLEFNSLMSQCLSRGLFKPLKSLEFIDLGNNWISEIKPQTFYGLTHLVVLHMESNYLKSLPNGLFGPLKSLTLIDFH